MTAAALALLTALVAPAQPKSPESVRILAIELSSDGTGGAIRTEATRLSGTDRKLQFGEGACRKYPLADRVLAQLFDAMQHRREVIFETHPTDKAHCVRRVHFLAPQP